MGKQASRIAFTAARIEALECPPGKSQSFIWDLTAPALLLRVSKQGRKTFVFESRLDGKTVRMTIGGIRDWRLDDARKEATRLQTLVDRGADPREEKLEQQRQREAKRQQREAEAATFGEAWERYMADRWPDWGEHHRNDHVKQVREAGTDKKGRATPAGPLNCFVSMRLVSITPEFVEAWAEREKNQRATQARLGWRLLRAFFTWCQAQDEYKRLLPENPASAGKARGKLGRAKAKADTINKGQLPAFFDAVKKVSNPTMAVYFQMLLLTGARPGELLALKWQDVDTHWGSITLRDKDESKGGEDGTRDIPLTPYARHLLASLPRRNEWVFASPVTDGPISAPRRQLADAMRLARLKVTAHGLRRAFASLSEWVDPPLPAGLIAQIQDHKPSATAEKHYIVRELDLLALHHGRFEAWILEQANIDFNPQQEAGQLRLVAGKEAKQGAV